MHIMLTTALMFISPMAKLQSAVIYIYTYNINFMLLQFVTDVHIIHMTTVVKYVQKINSYHMLSACVCNFVHYA